MTQKELSYLEDAIGHETNIITIISETSKLLEDEKLITYMNEELKKHSALKNKLMGLLGKKANE